MTSRQTQRHERIRKILLAFHQVSCTLTHDEARRVFTDGVADAIDSEFDIPPAPSIPMPEIKPPSGTEPDYVSHKMRPNMEPVGWMFFLRKDRMAVPRGWSHLIGKNYPTQQAAESDFAKAAVLDLWPNKSHSHITPKSYTNYLQLKEVFVYA